MRPCLSQAVGVFGGPPGPGGRPGPACLAPCPAWAELGPLLAGRVGSSRSGGRPVTRPLLSQHLKDQHGQTAPGLLPICILSPGGSACCFSNKARIAQSELAGIKSAGGLVEIPGEFGYSECPQCSGQHVRSAQWLMSSLHAQKGQTLSWQLLGGRSYGQPVFKRETKSCTKNGLCKWVGLAH